MTKTATKTATKTKMTKVPTTLHDRMDKIQEMIEFLSNDIMDGTITNNEITDKLDEIVTKIENFKEDGK
jgi:tetrahydromethanopterin S-methyltransferase subunit G